MSVDTLTLAQRLRASELPANQAEAIAAAIGSAVLEGAATKDDVEQLKIALKGDVEQLKIALKGDVEQLKIAFKGDVEQLKASVKGDLQAMEARLETKIEGLHARLLTWFIGSLLTVCALMVALVKLQV